MGNSSSQELEEIREYLLPIHPGLADVPLTKSNTEHSYTQEKKSIFLALKDDQGKEYTREQLGYTMLHCYALTLCDEVGHPPKFWNIFESLLTIAREKGIALENPLA